MSGVYIHIPFCHRACTYCDFHFSTNVKNKDAVINSIVKEIELRKDYLSQKNIDTIYFGGGTPSVLSINDINLILDKLAVFYNWNNDAELTIECNPEDLSVEKLQDLKSSGFNRLSIGLQSFNDEELRWMNRNHTGVQSEEAVKRAQEQGFGNITIDLIYGSRFQDIGTWEETLKKAISLDIQHISAYNLTIEEKTLLGNKFRKGKEPAINDELSSEMFKLMIEKLNQASFIHYEISNFGKDGFFSRHNSSYWRGSEYLGLGPSAHSFNGSSRQWNISSNAAYISKIDKEEQFFEKESIELKDHYNEYVLTGLRTMWGCDKTFIQEKFGNAYYELFMENYRRFQKYMTENANAVILNDDGKLLADYISSEFFK